MKNTRLTSALPVLLPAAFVMLLACSDDDNDKNSVTTEQVVTATISMPDTGSAQDPHEVFFSFEDGTVVDAEDATGTNWDISFERPVIRLNGGTSGPGNAAATYVDDEDYNTVTEAPESGYVKDGDGPSDDSGLGLEDGNALTDWFNYDGTVIPKDRIYIIRTATGKYAKIQLLDYYNDAGTGGYYKFKYTYQPGGSRVLE